jgi:hypothetical protein
MLVKIDDLTYEAVIGTLTPTEMSVQVTGGKMPVSEYDWVIFDESDLVGCFAPDGEPQPSDHPPLLRRAAEQTHEELLLLEQDTKKCHELCRWVNDHDNREPDEHATDPIEADLGRYLREMLEAKAAHMGAQKTAPEDETMQEIFLQMIKDGEPQPNSSDPRPYKDSGFTYGQLGAAFEAFANSFHEEWAKMEFDELTTG